MELATDLASLALYDIVIYADDSGSMIFEEGGDRINDLKLILGRVAEVTSLFVRRKLTPFTWNDHGMNSSGLIVQRYAVQLWVSDRAVW